MANVYSPVFSPATGWVVGKIVDHVARALTESEVKEACSALVDGAAKLVEVEAVRDEKHWKWNEAELDIAALRSEVKSLTDQRDRALKRVTVLSEFSIHAEHEARAHLHAAEEESKRLRALLAEVRVYVEAETRDEAVIPAPLASERLLARIDAALGKEAP